MKLEKTGNLGRVDLGIRMLDQKYAESYMNGTEIILSKEECKELEYQLKQFNYLLSNAFFSENLLADAKINGLLEVVRELEPMYREFDPEKEK